MEGHTMFQKLLTHKLLQKHSKIPNIDKLVWISFCMFLLAKEQGACRLLLPPLQKKEATWKERRSWRCSRELSQSYVTPQLGHGQGNRQLADGLKIEIIPITATLLLFQGFLFHELRESSWMDRVGRKQHMFPRAHFIFLFNEGTQAFDIA